MRRHADRSLQAELPWVATRRLSLVGLLSSLVILGGVAAQTETASATDRSQRGRAIARAHCSPCHAIGKRDPSPTRINKDTAFRDLYRRYPIAMLLKALKTGTIEGHDEMPAFDLPPMAMIDLLAYIDSLAPPKAPKYLATVPQ